MKTCLAPRSAAAPSHHQVASNALEAVGLLQLLTKFDGTQPLLVNGEKVFPQTTPADWQDVLLNGEKVIRKWLTAGGYGRLLLSIPRPARQTAITFGGDSYPSAHEAAVGNLMKMVRICKEQLADDLEASPSSWPSILFTEEAAARMAERLPLVSPEDIDRLQVELDLERDAWAACPPNRAPARQRRRRRTPPSPTRPLTTREVEAMQTIGEHKGNQTEAARSMGVSRQWLCELLENAHRKIASKTPRAESVKTRRLPSDKRGQVTVEDHRGAGG